MKPTETQLLKKLQNYGLKPNQWQLTERKNNFVKIQNKKEQSFSFLGITTTKNGIADWKYIQLLSL